MRDRLIGTVIAILFILLIAGLIYVQILRFAYYSELSKNNSIRIIPIDGPRGNMIDRNGVILVNSRLSFDAAIIYREIRNTSRIARILKEVLGMSGEDIIRAFEKSRQRPYAPVVICEDVDKDRALILEEMAGDTDGLVVETRPRRNYIYKDSGSHLFGYLSEVSEDELSALSGYGYRIKDLVGRDGLEKYYERYLKGVDGGTQVEVDSRGRQTKILGLKEPSPGRDLRLTIDVNLQLACDKLLGQNNGAVIVMNPKDGEILALASHPAFDPNIFIRPQDSAERVRLIKDKTGRPMSNRAISGLYPPGSIFKIVVAAAALETKKIDPDTHFFCGGSYKLGNAKFDCWKEEGHGSQILKQGIMNSCNVFFYNVGRLTGVDSIELFAKLFGFGRLTGIDLTDEVKGVVPGKAWKRLYRNEVWYEGETINYSIGQGYLLVTPIQAMNMVSVIANGGSLVRPHIVKKIGSATVQFPKPKKIGLKDSTVREIKEGMSEVVNNENGTGRRAGIEDVIVCGKTGTAQNPQGPTHAWFAGFAPRNGPKIAVIVFLEHGGKGGLSAAAIAGGIFKEARDRGYL